MCVCVCVCVFWAGIQRQLKIERETQHIIAAMKEQVNVGATLGMHGGVGVLPFTGSHGLIAPDI